jgi:hypothetical protein
MSLSDEEKMIDRAARHEEVRFLKKQQWAVAAAGVVLIAGLLAILKDRACDATRQILDPTSDNGGSRLRVVLPRRPSRRAR